MRSLAISSLPPYADIVATAGLAVLAALLRLVDAPLSLSIPAGAVAVAVLPGYPVTLIAFPSKTDLSRAERFALSVGVSVCVIALLTLMLDRTPWGLAERPVLIALTAWTLAAAALAWRRKTLTGSGEARVSKAAFEDSRRTAVGWHVFVPVMGALALCVAALFATVAAPTTPATEFYIVGPDGLSEDYPRRAAIGDKITVTAGITNREPHSVTFRVQVVDAGARRGDPALAPLHTRSVSIGGNETVELPISFVLRAPGPDREITISLYRDSASAPFRSLRLWLSVT